MTTNTFAYNGFGARVSKSDSSGSNTYLRASSGLIGSIVADSAAKYTPGVSEKRGTTSTYYHADIKNSVEQTSTGQGVAASKQYDAFGNEVSSSGPWQGPFQYGGAFGYHTDSDYGLKHLGARYYDSTSWAYRAGRVGGQVVSSSALGGFGAQVGVAWWRADWVWLSSSNGKRPIVLELIQEAKWEVEARSKDGNVG